MRYIQQFIVFAVLAIILSCNFSEEFALKQKLTDKYGEKFTIRSHGYNWVLKTYQFQASAVRFPEFIFVGEHNEDFSVCTDQYMVKYLSYIYTKQAKKELEHFISPVYITVSLTFNNEAYSYNNIHVDTLDLEKIFLDATSIYCSYYCFLFDRLDENSKKRMLTGLNYILHKHTGHNNSHISLDTYFWDKDFFNKYSIEDLGFDQLKSSYPDIGMEFRKYVDKGLYLCFDTDKPHVPFNIDSLYNWSNNLTPEVFGFPVTNLNEKWEELQKE